MQLKFQYSIHSELERVEDTLRSKDFYIENGYQFLLPKGCSFNSHNLSKIKNQISKEIDEDRVANIEKDIAKSWSKYQSKISAFLERLPYEKPETLLVTFTQYGSGGAYWLPNKIIVNINYDIKHFETIIHELIHLVIEGPVIDKFNISHWDKESLVDYLFVNDRNLRKIFPDYKYQEKEPDKKLLKQVGWC